MWRTDWVKEVSSHGQVKTRKVKYGNDDRKKRVEELRKMRERKMLVLCMRETRWKSTTGKELGVQRSELTKNEVEIVLAKEVKEHQVEVSRKSDKSEA